MDYQRVESQGETDVEPNEQNVAVLDQMRIYALDRMTKAELTTQTFTMPTVSRPEAALLADMLAERLGIANKWKFFEKLWHRNNMRSDYNTALDQRKSLEFQERLKHILG